MKTAAERIKAIRETFYMTRTQLAETLGITSSIISLMENGKANISRKTTRLLEEKLGINPAWLNYGTGEMFIRSDVFVASVLSKLQSVAGFNATMVEKSSATETKVVQWLEKIEEHEQLIQEAPERLMRIRNAFGLNQNQLAKRIGYTRAYISAVEKGIQRPSKQMAERIESEFGISADWLLYGNANISKCA